MTEPTLIGTKVELRFDTKLGARDCLPSAHRVMRESFNLTADDYMLVKYENEGDDGRLIEFVVGT